MNLAATLELYAGGPGSGCNPDKGRCGRPEGRVVYHGTLAKNVKSILQKGLVPGFHRNHDISKSGYVYLAGSKELAGEFAGWAMKKSSPYAIVTLVLPRGTRGLERDPDLRGYDSRGYRYKGEVTKSWFSSVEIYNKAGDLVKVIRPRLRAAKEESDQTRWMPYLGDLKELFRWFDIEVELAAQTMRDMPFTMTPNASFHPPSLKHPQRIPVDEPNETDNRFFDVTRRKLKDTLRDKLRLAKTGPRASIRRQGETTQIGLPFWSL